MHIHFIFPRWQRLLQHHPELEKTLSGYDIGAFQMAGRGVATAVGALPEGHSVTFLDEHASEIDFDMSPDLVALGFFTPQAANAYAIADQFRARGIPTLAGGIHPSMVPEETLEHFDAVVRGPVEGLWETLLTDLEQGHLRGVYQGDYAAPFAQPRNDLFVDSDYLRAGIIQTARGCRYGCPFCIIPGVHGKTEQLRPIDEVIEDIKALPYFCFFFADENLLFDDAQNTAYRRELMQAMIDAKIRKTSFLANYPFILKHLGSDDLDLLAAARMRQVYLVLGLKSPLKKELPDPELLDVVLRMKERGIEVFASFFVGNDLDDEPIKPLIQAYCEKTETNIAEFVISTPWPGTRDHELMEKDGRILHRDWNRYNCSNAVFQPIKGTPEDLESEYRDLWEWFYGRIDRSDMEERLVRGFGQDILRGNRPLVQ